MMLCLVSRYPFCLYHLFRGSQLVVFDCRLRPMQPTQQALFDAHCHLQNERLPALQHVLQESAAAGVTYLSCNGCWQEDWERVAAAAAAAAEPALAEGPHGSVHQQPIVVPNFGLHPWWVPRRSHDWLQRLRHMLEAHPSAGLGEVSSGWPAGVWAYCCERCIASY